MSNNSWLRCHTVHGAEIMSLNHSQTHFTRRVTVIICTILQLSCLFLPSANMWVLSSWGCVACVCGTGIRGSIWCRLCWLWLLGVSNVLLVTLGMYELPPPPPCALYVRDKAVPWLAGSSMLLDKALIILAYTRLCTHTHIYTPSSFAYRPSLSCADLIKSSRQNQITLSLLEIWQPQWWRGNGRLPASRKPTLTQGRQSKRSERWEDKECFLFSFFL